MEMFSITRFGSTPFPRPSRKHLILTALILFSGVSPLWLYGQAQTGMPNEEDATVKLQEEAVPEASLGQEFIKATVSQTPTGTTISPRLFGLNSFKGFETASAARPGYQKAMTYMNPGFIRYHYAGMTNDSKKDKGGWVDYANQRWDEEKIVKALSTWRSPTAENMICISGWPKYMDEDNDGFLDKSQYEAFATFCAELVRIINVTHGFKIPYFEITNEKDGRYWVDATRKGKKDDVDELAKIYNLCAEAMKQVDPSIKTGGPAAMRSDMLNPLRRFAEKTKDNLDFFSVHAYASGNLKESDTNIYRKAKSISNAGSRVARMIKEISPERPIEVHLNEYNISWTWETREPRMINYKGAVFDALCFIHFTESGITVTNAWNDVDGVYGKMSGDLQLRPAAHVFHLVNNHFVGKALKIDAPKTAELELFAAKNESGTAVLAVNRSDNPVGLKVAFSDLQPKILKHSKVGEAGFDESMLEYNELSQDGIMLAGHSVSVFKVETSSIAPSATPSETPKVPSAPTEEPQPEMPETQKQPEETQEKPGLFQRLLNILKGN
ncbi:MAG: hypothetical protein AAF558_15405 [Verrucomicrobiota bacterium]